MVWGGFGLGCLAVGAAEARTGHAPSSFAIKAGVELGGVLQDIITACWAGAAGVEPVTVSVQAVLDMIVAHIYPVFPRQRLGFIPCRCFHFE